MEKRHGGLVTGQAEDFYGANMSAVPELKPCACCHGWPCWTDSTVCGDYGCFDECPRFA